MSDILKSANSYAPAEVEFVLEHTVWADHIVLSAAFTQLPLLHASDGTTYLLRRLSPDDPNAIGLSLDTELDVETGSTRIGGPFWAHTVDATIAPDSIQNTELRNRIEAHVYQLVEVGVFTSQQREDDIADVLTYAEEAWGFE